MRKLVTDHLISLDGFGAGPEGEIDWFRFDEESQEWSRRLLREAGVILLGRCTYELFLQYWPTPEALKNEPVITERLTSLPKKVFSHSLDLPSWENTEFVRQPPSAVVRELKQGSGGHVLLLGSANLLAQLWDDELVDELHLRLQPTVLGQGQRLFPATEARQSWELSECHRFQSGVTALRYERRPAAEA